MPATGWMSPRGEGNLVDERVLERTDFQQLTGWMGQEIQAIIPRVVGPADQEIRSFRTPDDPVVERRTIAWPADQGWMSKPLADAIIWAQPASAETQSYRMPTRTGLLDPLRHLTEVLRSHIATGMVAGGMIHQSYRMLPRPFLDVQRISPLERSLVASNPTFDPATVASAIDGQTRSFRWELRLIRDRDRYRTLPYSGAAIPFSGPGGGPVASWRPPERPTLDMRRHVGDPYNATYAATASVVFDPTGTVGPATELSLIRLVATRAWLDVRLLTPYMGGEIVDADAQTASLLSVRTLPRPVLDYLRHLETWQPLSRIEAGQIVSVGPREWLRPPGPPRLDYWRHLSDVYAPTYAALVQPFDATTAVAPVDELIRSLRVVGPAILDTRQALIAGSLTPAPIWNVALWLRDILHGFRVDGRGALDTRKTEVAGSLTPAPIYRAELFPFLHGLRTPSAPWLDMARHLTVIDQPTQGVLGIPLSDAAIDELVRTFRSLGRPGTDVLGTLVAGSLTPAPIYRAELFPSLHGLLTPARQVLNVLRTEVAGSLIPAPIWNVALWLQDILHGRRTDPAKFLDTRKTEVLLGSLTPAPIYRADLFPRLHGERPHVRTLLDLWRHLADMGPSYSQTFPFSVTSTTAPIDELIRSFLTPGRGVLDTRKTDLAGSLTPASVFDATLWAGIEEFLRSFRMPERRVIGVWPERDHTEVKGSLTPAPIYRAEIFPRLHGERVGKRGDERRWDVPPMLWREQPTFDVTTTVPSLDELWRSFLALGRPRLGIDRQVQGQSGSLIPAPIYQASLYAATRILDLRTPLGRVLGVLADRDMPLFMGSLTPVPIYRAELSPRLYGELPSVRRLLDLIRHTTDINPSYSRTIPFDPTITVGSIDELIRSLLVNRRPVLDTRQTLVQGSLVPAPNYRADLYAAVRIWDEWARGRRPLDPRDYEVKQVDVPVPIMDARLVLAALDLLTRSVRVARGPILDPRDYEVKQVMVPSPIMDPKLIGPALDFLLRSYRATGRRVILPGYGELLEPQMGSLTPVPIFPGSLFAGVPILDLRVPGRPSILVWVPADLSRVRDVPTGFSPEFTVAAIRALESYRVRAARVLGWADLIGSFQPIHRFFYPIPAKPVLVSGGDDRFSELLGGGSQALIIVGSDDRITTLLGRDDRGIIVLKGDDDRDVQSDRSGGP